MTFRHAFHILKVKPTFSVVVVDKLCILFFHIFRNNKRNKGCFYANFQIEIIEFYCLDLDIRTVDDIR